MKKKDVISNDDNKANKKKGKAKVSDIICIVIGLLLLAVTAFGITYRLKGQDFFIFGSRMDVVLTDSMSSVHNDNKKEYEEKGWNNQIQVNDLIISAQIVADTEIKIGDIVTYSNPALGKLTHRVYNIYIRSDGETMYTIKADKANYTDGNFTRNQLISKVTSNAGQIGVFVAFLQSFWGMLCIIGLAIICFVYSFFVDLPPKAERIKAKEEKKRLKEEKQKNKNSNKKKNEEN